MIHQTINHSVIVAALVLFPSMQRSEDDSKQAKDVNIAGASSLIKKDVYSKSHIISAMHKVADWQLANPVSFNSKNENDWARAAFYTGVMATYRTTQDEKYLRAATDWSQSCHWKL